MKFFARFLSLFHLLPRLHRCRLLYITKLGTLKGFRFRVALSARYQAEGVTRDRKISCRL